MEHKLAGESIGAVLGTFAPMHVGHYQEIMEAKRENDGAVVVVSGYKGDRGDTSPYHLTLSRRERAIRKLFADDPLVDVGVINEDNIPRYPNGWDPWFKMFQQVVLSKLEDTDTPIVYYVGEPEYKTELNKRIRIQDEVVLVNRHGRKDTDTSGTAIRKDPINNWNKIMRPYRPYFSNNVVITGGSSTGKTQLVQDLARSFTAPFVPEYSRLYQDVHNENTPDDDLTAWDYQQLLTGQYNLMRDAIKSSGNQGIVFDDTDAIVTYTYAELWLPNKKDVNFLYHMTKEVINNSRISLVLMVPPVDNFVNDGYRNAEFADLKARDTFYKELKANYKEFNIPYIELTNETSNRDRYGYYARYLQALNIIRDRLGVKM